MTRLPRWTPMLAGIVLLLGLHDPAAAATRRFAVAGIHMERNATDNDLEVVIEAIGGEDGLVRLKVTAPDGHDVVDFTAPARSLGLRQFRFESPEPEDMARLRAAYPEGTYTFTGVAAGGDTLHGRSHLVHGMPAPASVAQPKAGARGLAMDGLEVTWAPVAGAVGYELEIDQDELHANITAKLPGSATSFAVPKGFLVPGRRYVLGVGAVMASGNATFVESSFTTAGKK
jgi:hypothetical protein